MGDNILMHLLPLSVMAAYLVGFLYIWYRNARGK